MRRRRKSAADEELDAAFQRRLSAVGAVVDVMKLGPMRRAAVELIAAGVVRDDAVAEAVERFRVKS